MARALALALTLLALAAPRPAAATRVKDLADVVGVRENALYGYGLVIGLNGTGDNEQFLVAQQSLAGLLGRMGIRVDPKDVRARNVAAVMVTGKLPAFARPGSRIDVAVASMGNARSLAGGVLLLTPLTGGDGKVYGVAQGSVQVAGFEAGTRRDSVTKNTPTSGRVAGGGTVERAVLVDLAAGPITLALRTPDMTTSSRLAAAINGKLGAGTAKATDPAAVVVTLPEAQKEDPIGFLSTIELLDVDADHRARVVVSERTGTVVIGDGVKIRPVAVAHGAIRVQVHREPVISQPLGFGANAPGRTVSTTSDTTTATEGGVGAIALPATSTVEDLAKALTTLGATPRDLISVLEAMKAAGALDAELEVLQ